MTSILAAQEEESVKGVNPKENLTKVEVLYKYDKAVSDGYTQALTFKYDQALSKQVGFNIEIPVVNFSGYGIADRGLGDINLRVRYIGRPGFATPVFGAEVVVKTASKDTLGSGKWQANPTAGCVFAVSQFDFLYIGYKHVFSVAGDESRTDLRASQPRLLVAHTSSSGWWVLGDLKYTKSWAAQEPERLDCEVEFGQMISRNQAVWIRGGGSALDKTRNWGVNLGWRGIF